MLLKFLQKGRIRIVNHQAKCLGLAEEVIEVIGEECVEIPSEEEE